MNWKLLLLSVLFLSFQKTMFSKSVYVHYDAQWMDIYEYEMNDEGLIRPITSFYLKTSNKDGYFFKVGDLNRNKLKINKIDITEKSELTLSEELVRDINADKTEFYIVQTNAEGTYISKVLEAVHFYSEDQQIALNMPQLVFSYDEADTFEKNLATEDSRYEVNVLNIKKRECTKIVTFQKTEKNNTDKQYQIVICPKIGILSQQIINQIDVTLKKINGVEIEQVLNQLCQIKKNETIAAVSTPKTTTATDVFTSKGATEKVSEKSTESDPCSPSKVQGVHIVQEGESLYAISKKYNKSVKQLCEWNGIRTDLVLQPCTKLIVDNSPIQTPQSEEFRSKGEQKVSIPAWKDNTTGFHTVTEGETLEGIAAKYGYTVSRILVMNGLTNEASVTVGQKLKISDCACPVPPSPVETTKKEVPTKVNADSNPKILTGKEKTMTPKGATKAKFYIVKEDDTLISVAKKFNTSLEQLRKLNQLDEKDIIVPFQKIRVE